MATVTLPREWVTAVRSAASDDELHGMLCELAGRSIAAAEPVIRETYRAGIVSAATKTCSMMFERGVRAGLAAGRREQ